MKTRIFFLLVVIITLSFGVSAQRVNFALGIDGGSSFSKLDYTDYWEDGGTHRTWDLGIQGEARVRLASFVQVNTNLSLNFNSSSYRYKEIPSGGSEYKDYTFKSNGVAIQLTEYFNFKIWRGFGIGTGPAVKFISNDKPYFGSKWRGFWAFGVDKDFGKITARITWNQLLHSSRHDYDSMLNLAVLYCF